MKGQEVANRAVAILIVVLLFILVLIMAAAASAAGVWVPRFRRQAQGGAPQPRNAWVVLNMTGDYYIPGALATAWSIRQHKTKHALVCMVTNDVSEIARKQLALVFDEVVEVPYLTYKTNPPPSNHQRAVYGGWVDNSFTKWNALNLTQYSKVCFVDADFIHLSNCDELHGLRAPAACFSNPWAAPYSRGKKPMLNPYVRYGNNRNFSATPLGAPRRHGLRDEKPVLLKHGDAVPAAVIVDAITRQQAFASIGAVVLLEPNAADYEAFKQFVGGQKPYYGAKFPKVPSTADESSIDLFYAQEKRRDWAHIGQEFEMIPWKEEIWSDGQKARAWHYMQRKPWEDDPAQLVEYKDLQRWWDVADDLIKAHPELKEAFYPDPRTVSPLDIDYSQYKITGDIRRDLATLARSRHRDRDTAIDAALRHWHTSMRASDDPNPSAWSTIYREDFDRAQLERILIADGALDAADAPKMVAEIARKVASRLHRVPVPTRMQPRCDGEKVYYASSTVTPVTPRVQLLLKIAGCEAVAAAAMRYGIVAPGATWESFTAHHYELLRGAGVRNQAFSSPFGARARLERYFSPFPDVDVPLRSEGEFFATFEEGKKSMQDYEGAWLCEPSEELAVRAAKVIVAVLSVARPLTITFATCSAEAAELLETSPALVASKWFASGTVQRETIDGRRSAKAVRMYYACLSNEKPDKVEMAKLLDSIMAR